MNNNQGPEECEADAEEKLWGNGLFFKIQTPCSKQRKEDMLQNKKACWRQWSEIAPLYPASWIFLLLGAFI